MDKLYSGLLNIDYGQFYIDSTEPHNEKEEHLDPDKAFEDHENGLCGSAQFGKIFFVAGLHVGVIKIDVELYSFEPELDQSFEEIVEVSFTRGNKSISLCEMWCEQAHTLDLPKGDFRVRYSVSGMDNERDDESDWQDLIPGQRHLIQMWSASPTRDKLLKYTSESAAYWHREWGALR